MSYVDGLILFELLWFSNCSMMSYHPSFWVKELSFNLINNFSMAIRGLHSWKKISRYVGDISPIYHVSEGMNMIFYGEILLWQNFERNLKKNRWYFPIYRRYGDKSWIFCYISNSQCEVNVATMQLQYSCYKKVWGSTNLTTRTSLPLLNVMH